MQNHGMPSTTTFTLTAAEQAELQKPANGQGGHQTVMLMLQSKLQPDGTITLTDTELGRVVRYSGYAQGGFQNRFKDAFHRSITAAIART